MWKLLSRAVREVWTVLRFIAFLTEGTYYCLRVVWFALRHPVWAFAVVLLGYVVLLTVRTSVLPPA
ncbi:hypothetical protein [Pandoraea sputorum]